MTKWTILAAGDKSGGSTEMFYERLIKLAEKRMAKYNAVQKAAEEKFKKK